MTNKKKPDWKKRLRAGASTLLDSIFFLRVGEEGGPGSNGPSWKFRRKLIYGGYRLGVAMIVFGALTYTRDMYGVGSALITGGVSLISIILTAYTATATYEDVKLWQKKDESPIE